MSSICAAGRSGLDNDYCFYVHSKRSVLRLHVFLQPLLTHFYLWHSTGFSMCVDHKGVLLCYATQCVLLFKCMFTQHTYSRSHDQQFMLLMYFWYISGTTGMYFWNYIFLVCSYTKILDLGRLYHCVSSIRGHNIVLWTI